MIELGRKPAAKVRECGVRVCTCLLNWPKRASHATLSTIASEPSQCHQRSADLCKQVNCVPAFLSPGPLLQLSQTVPVPLTSMQ